jgi:transposase-like protein
MERKGIKISAETKIECAKLVAGGKIGAKSLADQRNFNQQRVRYWVALYKAHGETAFFNFGINKVYPLELKLQAVNDYLNGKGSYETIAAEYGLRAEWQLRQWVKMYNNGEDFSHKMSGGSRMTTSRKTTKEERFQIVKECIANGCNYGECAIKYNVSYQQVYGWVKRFKELGEAGLEDRRGRRKADQEPRSEIEKLQIENERLKHELYMMKMERDLLKKVKELERKDLYRK